MIKYPQDLPYPLLASVNLNQRSNILKTEMSSGKTRTRLRFLSTPTTMTATWLLTKLQAAVFEGFITHEIGVINPFLMKIPTPLGLIEHRVKFLTSPLEKYKPLGAGRWQFSANIELTREILTSEDTTFYLENEITDLNSVVKNIEDKLVLKK